MSAQVTDNLPLLAGAPNGIKKLRELILELAVRGKLVPQDPNDEPASELLKRIAEEVRHLVAKGKSNEQIAQQEIDDATVPFTASKNWAWIKLGDISLIERGGSPRPIKDFLTDDPNGLNWIKIGDTEKGGKYITSAAEKIKREGLVKTRMVYPGDFLLTNSMSYGRPYITQIEGCIHDGWLRISPPNSLVKDYLYLLLSSPYVRCFFVGAAAGAVVLNLNADKVRELPIPLPPLAEQHRIVAKVDKLMALCDRLEAKQADAERAHAQLVQALLDSLTQAADADDFAQSWQRLAEHFHTLFTTESSIDALKQTLLQLAVMGKLVPQDPNDEPASELLKQIAEEKALLVKAKAIRGGKPLPEIEHEEMVFTLPIGWSWVRLGQIGDWGAGATPSRGNTSYYGGEMPWFKSGELVADFISSSEETVTELALKECSLRRNKPGDVLIAMYGATIGKTSILNVEGTTNQAVCACTPFNGVFNRYLLLTLKALKSNFIGQGAGGAQPNISREKIIATVAGLPPLAEQYRIVAKVDQLMALCEQLKQRLTQARSLHERLANTLVEQAVV